MTRRPTAGILVACLLIAGCTGEAGKAVPQQTTTAPAVDVTTPAQTPQPEPEDPPAVTGGPDMGTWWQRACDLLGDATAQRIGILGDADGGAGSDIRASCVREAGGQRLEYELFTLDSMFYQPYASQREWRYYAAAFVGGQPAGVFSEEADPATACTVVVGLNPDSSIRVALRAEDDPEVCGRALATAEAVVTGIAGG